MALSRKEAELEGGLVVRPRVESYRTGGAGASLRAGSSERRAAQERERGEKRGGKEDGKAARDEVPLYLRSVFRWQKPDHARSGEQ